MTKYVKRIDAYLKLLSNKGVKNRNEFDKRYPKSKWVFVKSKYGIVARKRKR